MSIINFIWGRGKGTGANPLLAAFKGAICKKKLLFFFCLNPNLWKIVWIPKCQFLTRFRNKNELFLQITPLMMQKKPNNVSSLLCRKNTRQTLNVVNPKQECNCHYITGWKLLEMYKKMDPSATTYALDTLKVPKIKCQKYKYCNHQV